ncbi:MAG TPA: hypothetical protein VMU80_13415 [Bryobacteraceae bacterium]|nr:hypothetical protein [Bryobacteraceae bacterium]
MSREEIQKLLGGYATGTLTEAEQRDLFAAALEDQELFDALAKEQALHDVLREPAARRQLIEALGPPREPFGVRVWQWLRRPAGIAMTAGLAVTLIIGAIVLRKPQPAARPETIVADATLRQAPLPETAPAPKPVQARSAVIRRPKLKVAVQEEAAPVPALPPPAAPALPPAPVAVAQFAPPPVLPAATVSRASAAGSPSPVSPFTYSLLVGQPDGTYSPMAAGAALRAGDSVRLQVTPGSSGFLYLFRHSESGWRMITGQPVEQSVSYQLPSTGAVESIQPAQIQLLLVLSSQGTTLGDIDLLASGADSKAKATVRRFAPGLMAARAPAPVSPPPAVLKIGLEFH